MNLRDGPPRFGRRLRRPDSGKIPVTVFTGFLGAGKTTLIQRLIATPEGKGSAILVKEFSNIGIDQAVLATGGETTTLLSNGCLCCAFRTDLQEALRSLFAARKRGESDFKRVIIEASGLSDPAGLLQSLSSDRALMHAFHLTALVAVVDGCTSIQTLAEHDLARKQIVLSDRVVVSKGDMISPEQLDHVCAAIRGMTRGRPLAVMTEFKLDPDFILREDMDLDARKMAFYADEPLNEGQIDTFPIFFDGPLAWEEVALAMRTLIELRGSDLLRVKGLLSIIGCKGPVLFHASQNVMHDPVELQAWPDADQRSRLVFITRDLRHATVERLFALMREIAARSELESSNI